MARQTTLQRVKAERRQPQFFRSGRGIQRGENVEQLALLCRNHTLVRSGFIEELQPLVTEPDDHRMDIARIVTRYNSVVMTYPYGRRW